MMIWMVHVSDCCHCDGDCLDTDEGEGHLDGDYDDDVVDSTARSWSLLFPFL